MTKLLTASFALALLLTGCGANPSASHLYQVRNAQSAAPRQAMPAPLDQQITRALQLQFQDARISVSDVSERRDDPGTYKFTAQLQSRTRRVITTLDGEFDLPSRTVRVLNSNTEAL